MCFLTISCEFIFSSSWKLNFTNLTDREVVHKEKITFQEQVTFCDLNQPADIRPLVEHFFRNESGKMVAVLTKIFGTANLDLAEDVVQDAMLEAIRQWQTDGVPDNTSAWLFRVAKNKALNIVNREKYKRQYSDESIHFLQSAWTAEPALDYLFSSPQIQDDQLRMIFTCCHPSITIDSQVALALKTICRIQYC